MSKKLLVVHPGDGEEQFQLDYLGRQAQVQRVGCSESFERAASLIAKADGEVDAIGLEGITARLELGETQSWHETGVRLTQAASRTPVVDGSGVRGSLERWGVGLLERAQPGLCTDKRVLMVPGLNHTGLAQALGRRASQLRYIDPVIFFGVPAMPGIGSPPTLGSVASPSLGVLRRTSVHAVLRQRDEPRAKRARALFDAADVLAGNVTAIRNYAPQRLDGKTVLVEFARDDDLNDLQRRGVQLVVTLMPSVNGNGGLAHHPAATIEALLTAFRDRPHVPPSEDTYLDMISELRWTPEVRYLQPGEQGLHRFAFVIHPLDMGFVRRHFRWSRLLPSAIIERLTARVPPMRLGRITGGRSPATGARIEGELIGLGSTPRQMLSRSPEFTYDKLCTAARMAESRGARLIGLGAFTSVVGDAGKTVARRSPIAVTSGNSLTVVATLEVAKQAARKLGHEDLSRGRAMVIGATGSIGSVCARMLAEAVRDVVLVSVEPEKLIELKRRIRRETPGSQVVVATSSVGLVEDCDLIVTATSAFGQRVLDISQCKPGAIVCDVARPPDISEAEAALRPDVLVIESGEVVIPGDVEIGYDIGLPPGVVYACLGETALLAMEGRFESYTLGRELSMQRVKEIYRLFLKHDFRLAGLRCLGHYLTDEELAEKGRRAQQLRDDPELFQQVVRSAAEQLAKLPATSKGVRGKKSGSARWLEAPRIHGWLESMAAWLRAPSR